jgi:hypothetical protein
VAVGLGVASGAVLALIGILPRRIGSARSPELWCRRCARWPPPLLMAGVYATEGSFGIGMTILSALLLMVAAHLRAGPQWSDALPAPPAEQASGRDGLTSIRRCCWAGGRGGT